MSKIAKKKFVSTTKKAKKSVRKRSTAKGPKKKHLEKTENKKTDDVNENQIDCTVKTQTDVGKIFGVNSRTVRNWIAEYDMPVNPDGTYDLRAIQLWRNEKMDRRGRSKQKKAPADEDRDWDVEYRKWKALVEEIKYEKIVGNLFERSDIERGLVEICLVIKQNFLALPKSVAPQLHGLEIREIEAILDERVREIVEMFQNDRVFEISQQQNEEDLTSDDNVDAKTADNMDLPGSPGVGVAGGSHGLGMGRSVQSVG